MNDIKRYWPDYSWKTPTMLEADEGGYVKYDDHEAEFAQQQTTINELTGMLKWYAEKAEAVSKYMVVENFTALEAVLIELRLDKGQKAKALITKTKSSKMSSEYNILVYVHEPSGYGDCVGPLSYAKELQATVTKYIVNGDTQKGQQTYVLTDFYTLDHNGERARLYVPINTTAEESGLLIIPLLSTPESTE